MLRRLTLLSDKKAIKPSVDVCVHSVRLFAFVTETYIRMCLCISVCISIKLLLCQFISVFRLHYKNETIFLQVFSLLWESFSVTFSLCVCVKFFRHVRNVADRIPFCRTTLEWINEWISQPSNRQTSQPSRQQIELTVQMVKIVDIIWWHAILCLTKPPRKRKRNATHESCNK